MTTLQLTAAQLAALNAGASVDLGDIDIPATTIDVTVAPPSVTAPPPPPPPPPPPNNPQLAAPGQFTLPAGAVSVFTNGKFNWPGDWSFGGLTVDYTATGGLDGDCVLCTSSGQWAGWQPYAPFAPGTETPTLDLGSLAYLCLSIEPSLPNPAWGSSWMETIAAAPGEQSVGQGVSLAPYAVGSTINGFQAYKIPLGKGGFNIPAGTVLRKFQVNDQSGSAANRWRFDRVFLSVN